MANGKIYNPDLPIAASKTLPFGTKLEILNPTTNKMLTATVYDRGPYVCGRDLDVSESVARRLGFWRKGVTELLVLPLNNIPPERLFYSTTQCHKVKPRHVRQYASVVYSHTKLVRSKLVRPIITTSKINQMLTNHFVRASVQQPPEVLQLELPLVPGAGGGFDLNGGIG
jgi:rare lipoprotein A (peptidoglycan hydrolase)